VLFRSLMLPTQHLSWGTVTDGVTCAIVRLENGSSLTVAFMNVMSQAIFLTPCDSIVDLWRTSDCIRLGLKVHASQEAGVVRLDPGQCVELTFDALPLACLRPGKYSVVVSCRPMLERPKDYLFLLANTSYELVSGPFTLEISENECRPQTYSSPSPSRLMPLRRSSSYDANATVTGPHMVRRASYQPGIQPPFGSQPSELQ